MPPQTPSWLTGRTGTALATGALAVIIGVAGRSMLSASVSTPFPDVPDNYPYLQAINFVRKNEVMTGHDDGTFRPNVSLQRIELVKIVMTLNSTTDQRFACTERMRAEPVPFNDIQTERGIWYWPYLCLAHERGIINGYPDGSFKPTKAVSFAELSKIVAKAFGIEPIVVVEDDAPWYARPMQALYDHDLVPPTVQEPAVPVSRGETAEVLYRILKQAADGRVGDEGWHGAAPSQQGDVETTSFDFGEWASRFSWTQPEPKGLRPIRGATSSASIYLEDEDSSSSSDDDESSSNGSDDNSSGSSQHSSNDSSDDDGGSSSSSRSTSGGTTSGSLSRTTTSSRTSVSSTRSTTRSASSDGQTSSSDSSDNSSTSDSSDNSSTSSDATSSATSSSVSSFPVNRYPATYEAISYDEVRDRKFFFRDMNGGDEAFSTFFSIYGFLPNVVSSDPGFLPESNGTFSAETLDRWEWFIRDNAEFFGIDDPGRFHFDDVTPGKNLYVASDPAFPFQLPFAGQYNPFGSLRLQAQVRYDGTSERRVAVVTGHWWPEAGFPNPRFTFDAVAERLIDKEIRLIVTVRSSKVLVDGQVQSSSQAWGYGGMEDNPLARWTPCDPPAWCPEPEPYEWWDDIQPEDLTVNLMYMGFIPQQGFNIRHEDTKLELRLVHRVTFRRDLGDGVTVMFTKYYDAIQGNELKIPVMCPAQERVWPEQNGFDPSALDKPTENPDQDIEGYPKPLTSNHRLQPPDDPESWQGLSIEELIDRRKWEFIDRNPDVSFDLIDMDSSGIIRQLVTRDPRFVQDVDDDVPEYPLEWSQIDFNGGEQGEWRALLEDNAEFFGLERGFGMRHISHCPAPMDTIFGRSPRSLDIGYEIDGGFDLALRMMPTSTPSPKMFYASGGPRVTKMSGLYSTGQMSRKMVATLTMAFYPDASLPRKPVLARWEIEDRFRDFIPMDNLQIRLGPMFVWSGGQNALRLVYAVGTHFDDRSPMGLWEWIIDAMTGEELTQ